jgi:hypothetical protein
MNNFNFISLQAKCPVCSKSLMDSDHKIDNEPCIHLRAETPGKKGYIRLSSIYGSYNYDSEIDIEPGTIAVFLCPHCSSNITTKQLCFECRAPLSSVILEIGGNITFCSRAGCKNHNISFEDLSGALAKLSHESVRPANFQFNEIVNGKKAGKEKTQKDKRKEIIESGSFLQAYCPLCKKSLIEKDVLKIKIVKKEGESGYMLLSPYLNVFSSKSTIFLPEDRNIDDIRCFHCDKSLMMADNSCGHCGSRVAKIVVSARTKMIDFYICAKKGCTWHGLSKEDLDEISLEDNLEW